MSATGAMPMRRVRCGFTLIELLVVLLIVGVLAAIAVPKFGASKDKAYLASMKSDLRNLASAQEAYFADNASTYAPTPADLGAAFKVSAGVSITLSGVTSTGWTATAAHTASNKRCTLVVSGTATGAAAPDCN